MQVVWLGADLVKAYHDPQAGLVDVLVGRPVAGGEALAMGDVFSLSVDEEGAFCHLALDVRAPQEADDVPARPAQCPVADEALSEVVEGSRPRWVFDAGAGTLRVAFEGVDVTQWGRIGDNLLWLGLDDEAQLGAIVLEGVSRDPGGTGQATWLAEVGVD